MSTWVSKLLADSLLRHRRCIATWCSSPSWLSEALGTLFLLVVCLKFALGWRERERWRFLRQEEVRVVAAQCFSDGIGCGNCGRRIFWTRGLEHTGGIRRWGWHKRRRRRRCGSEGVQQACRWERESFRTLICKLIRLRYV